MPNERTWSEPIFSADPQITVPNIYSSIKDVLNNLPKKAEKLPEVEVKKIINIDQSPMFRNQQFGRSSADIHGWLDTNSIANLSGRNNNLKKLNDKKHSSSNNYNQNNTIQYKQIVDDWSHSIYMVNLNPNSNEFISQMNSCKEIWDKQSLFDPDKINWDFGPCYNFSKVIIDGTHPNIDLVLSV